MARYSDLGKKRTKWVGSSLDLIVCTFNPENFGNSAKQRNRKKAGIIEQSHD